MATTALSAGIPIEPVELVLRRECHFKAKHCKVCGKAKSNKAHKKSGGDHKFAGSMGCAHCGRFKKDRCHFGTPPSLRLFGSGNMGAYIGLKASLDELYTELLEESGLPRGLDSVTVECQMTFPDRNGRDEGNLRFLVEKSLGDALVAGGWIPNDTFYPARHYVFGGIDPRYEAGVDELRLMIFPDLSSSGSDEVRDFSGFESAGDVDRAGLSVDVQVASADAEHHGVDRVAGPEPLAQIG